MNIQRLIETKVARMKAGRLITYDDFKELKATKPLALSKSLQRLVESGVLVREKRGVFYKPQKTQFGELRPSEEEILNFFLLKNGKYTGYLSGQDIFLKFKMTTQVPQEITIATSIPPRQNPFKGIRIRYIKSRVRSFYKDDIPILQLLDTIRFMKKVPDSTSDIVISTIKDILSNWDDRVILRMVKLALEYPPATRSIVGAILDLAGFPSIAATLKKSLNPLTSYKLGISGNILPNKKDWNIT